MTSSCPLPKEPHFFLLHYCLQSPLQRAYIVAFSLTIPINNSFFALYSLCPPWAWTWCCAPFSGAQWSSWASHKVYIVCMPLYFHSHWNAAKCGHSGQVPKQTKTVGIMPQLTAMQGKHRLHITANGCHWTSMALIPKQESKTCSH